MTLLPLLDPVVLRSLGLVIVLRNPWLSLPADPLGVPPPGGAYARGDDTGVAPLLLVVPIEPWLLPLLLTPAHRGDAGDILPSAILLGVKAVGLGMFAVVHKIACLNLP